MTKFNLQQYLENPSRKVCTRQGKSVRIICTDRRHTDSWPIVALEDYGDGEFVIYTNIDGRTDMCAENIHDLFFADEEREEPVNEDLEEVANKYAENHGFRIPYDGSNKFYDDVDVKASKEGYIAGAKYQKQKDQEIIELAEDHAMLAGMNKMKEEMMKDAIECICHQTEVEGIKLDSIEILSDGLILDSNKFKDGDKVKLIIIKEEQQ